MSDECSSGKIGDKHLFERQDIINNNENYEERGVCIGSDTASEFNFHLKEVYINGFEYGVKSHQWSCGGSGGENITFSNPNFLAMEERRLFSLMEMPSISKDFFISFVYRSNVETDCTAKPNARICPCNIPWFVCNSNRGFMSSSGCH